MNKKRIFLICLITFIFSGSVLTNSVYAEKPSVSDCLEGTLDCPKKDDSTSINEDDQLNESSSSSTNSGSLFFNFIKMGIALLFVLGLIYALLKFLNKRNKLFDKVKTLENLGGISVGSNKSLQLIRIGSDVFVIGVGENIELLHEIKDEELKTDLLDSANSIEESQISNLFSRFINRRNENKDADPKGNNEFKALFTSELDKLKQSRKKLINQQEKKEDEHE